MKRAVGVWAVVLTSWLAPATAEEAPFARTPWTTSKITGSPEPPLPFRVERFAPKLSFSNPTFVEFSPDGKRVFVGEQQGRVWSFSKESPGDKADLALDLKQEVKSWGPNDGVKEIGAVYDLCFDPAFAENRWVYLTYTLLSKTDKPLADGTRVSRFKLTDGSPPRLDPASEKLIVTWLEGGHNGGCLAFGPDGHLYVSAGDSASPNPPDVLGTGQDCRDFMSSILRLDVKSPANDPTKGYVVPSDNPFVSLDPKEVRHEIWAFGFRNPWKMSFDRGAGDLWVGDVGWELWELVDRVEKGGNYGWSIVEGRQPVRFDVKLGPSPVLPPTMDFPHTEAASITGGFVYRGKVFPELVGSYICGDWETRNMWAARWENGRVVEKKRIAGDTVRITDFGEDADGELYVLDYGDQAGLYKLERNEVDPHQGETFPRKLSESGLFVDTEKHQLAPGVMGFAVNAEQWYDGAHAERFVGLPGETTVKMHDKPQWIPGSMFNGKIFFPKDGVLARTLSLETTPGESATRRRIETQILHFDGKAWQGYSYRWNESQTDAELVEAGGRDENFTITDLQTLAARDDAKQPPETRTQRWHFPSRTECLQCHNPWSGYALAFNPQQLLRPAPTSLSPSGETQLAAFQRLRLLDAPEEKKVVPFVDPYGDGELAARARTYLHINCSHCHQMGAGGSVDLDLRYEMTQEQMKIVDVKPAQGTFGLDDAKIVAAGRPCSSALYFRIAKLGRGRMPHIGSDVVDVRGIGVVRNWIRSLGPDKPRDEAVEALANEALAADGQSASACQKVFESTGASLFAMQRLDEPGLEPAIRGRFVEAALKLPPGNIRDLFERFLPEGSRAERLGASFDRLKLLAMPGDAERGKRVFFEASGVTCKICHKVAGAGAALGAEVGPDLGGVGKKLTREQLLESLVEPSKTIDPKFAGYSLETTDGRALTGRLVERTEKRIVLRDAQGKDAAIESDDVETFVPLPLSLMPERLLQDLSPQEAADLLSYLESLKAGP